MYTMFISNNGASFYFWWKENLVKHQKVSKYHENDCRVPLTPSPVQKIMLLLLILQNESPQYLLELVPLKHSSYTTRNAENIPFFKTKFFKKFIFPKWNNLDHKIENAGRFSIFKNSILKFIRPAPDNAFDCENDTEIELITILLVSRQPELFAWTQIQT